MGDDPEQDGGVGAPSPRNEGAAPRTIGRKRPPWQAWRRATAEASNNARLWRQRLQVASALVVVAILGGIVGMTCGTPRQLAGDHGPDKALPNAHERCSVSVTEHQGGELLARFEPATQTLHVTIWSFDAAVKSGRQVEAVDCGRVRTLGTLQAEHRKLAAGPADSVGR